MGFGSIWPWLIVLAVVLLLFGRGKVSELMGDVAKGVKSFRRGLSDDEETARIEQSKAEPVNRTNTDERTNAR
jgi:sec-independent protein translocase protein TatA